MADRQSHAVDALEKALADARAGRLIGFAFVGIGANLTEQAVAYSFDDANEAVHLAMVGATRALLIDVAKVVANG